MKKEPECEGWADFGKAVAGVGCIVAGAVMLFLLLASPFERQKEVLSKLELLQYRVDRLTARPFDYCMRTKEFPGSCDTLPK